MANVLLTTRCVRSCPYCFAEKEMTDSDTGERMGWENLVHIASFLQLSGERHVSLLGGEPTLHPDFVDFVLYFVERNFHVTVFTSGVMSATRLAEIERHLTPIRKDRLQFVCNLNDPVRTPAPESEERRLEAFLAAMGPWTMPGFNIYREDFSLEFLVDLVLRHGLGKHLRLGISHPIPGGGGIHLPPASVGRVMDRLYAQRELLDQARMRPGFDCGFPLCQLSDEQLGWLVRSNGKASFTCSPALDITPDLSVYSCFPLSRYRRRSLLEFDSLDQVHAAFQQALDHLRIEVPGVYDECEHCVSREDRICAGGGMCHVLGQLVEEAPVRLPEIEHALPRTGLAV